MKNLTLALALTATPVATLGSTVVGNPSTGIVLADGSDVYVHSVTTVECGTNAQDTFTIDDTLDQWESAPLQLDEVDYCSVTVNVRWTSAGQLEAVDVTGFDVLSASSAGAAVEIELDETAGTALLVQ